MQAIPFKAEDHRMVEELFSYIRNPPACGFINKEVAELTGFGRNTSMI